MISILSAIHIVIFLLFDHHEAFYADQVNYRLVERELTCQCQQMRTILMILTIMIPIKSCIKLLWYDLNEYILQPQLFYSICSHNMHPHFAVWLWLHLYVFKHFVIKIKCFLATKTHQAIFTFPQFFAQIVCTLSSVDWHVGPVVAAAAAAVVVVVVVVVVVLLLSVCPDWYEQL